MYLDHSLRQPVSLLAAPISNVSRPHSDLVRECHAIPWQFYLHSDQHAHLNQTVSAAVHGEPIVAQPPSFLGSIYNAVKDMIVHKT